MRSHSAYQIGVIRTPDEFQTLREEWTSLYEASSPRNPFVSHPWLEACWTHREVEAELFIVTARDEGRLVGIAPLRMERRRGFRVLHYLGAGRSEYVSFLTHPDNPDLKSGLLTALEEVRGDWDLLLLRQLSDPFTELHLGKAPRGLRQASANGEVAPHLSFSGDWKAFVAEGPAQLRHSQRPARKWAREGGTVERVVGEEAAELLEAVAEVEKRSWKARERVLHFTEGPGMDLLRQALRSMGERGEMELWVARMEGTLAAYQINFVTPERVGYYYGAYDEEFRRFYPGGVVHLAAIRHAWETGRREYDL